MIKLTRTPIEVWQKISGHCQGHIDTVAKI